MEQQYLDLLKDVLNNGNVKDDRTGTGTLSVFGRMIRHDLNNGFPLITTKKLHIKSIIYELLWFLRGDTNIKWLNKHGVTIWDEWADKNGNLGKIYGWQWRNWKYDQIGMVIGDLKKNPNSRRHIISAWNVNYLPSENIKPQDNVKEKKMALAPCHVMSQFYVNEGKLSCLVTQRSADLFLGLPFNIASYAFLTHMIAQQTDLGVGELIFSLGDCHIYSNHIEQVREQLSREPRDLPILAFNRKPIEIDDYHYDDFLILGYYPHDAIKAPIAV